MLTELRGIIKEHHLGIRVEDLLVKDGWEFIPFLLVVGLQKGEPEAQNVLCLFTFVDIRNPFRDLHVHIREEIYACHFGSVADFKALLEAIKCFFNLSICVCFKCLNEFFILEQFTHNKFV